MRRVAHVRPRRPAACGRRRHPTGHEHGYVLITSALLLTTLMTFSALTIDVGAWLARATQIQRAADAAALAGVVWMPDLDQATTVAKEAAAKNGFVHGQNDISVIVSTQSGAGRQLRVSIRDGSVPQFFSTMVQKGQTITRSATAEYILPLPLGSPNNSLGSGNLNPPESAEHFWLAASGYCSGRENGDLRLAQHDRTYFNGRLNCPGYVTNPDYDPAGYFYAVELRQAPGQAVTIEVYDPSFHTSGSVADSALRTPAAITTTYRVLGPDSTPFDNTDNPVLSTTVVASADLAYRNAWMTLFTIPMPEQGQYFVQVQTAAGEANSYGSNGFALRAWTGQSFAACTSQVNQVGYSAFCPQVHGLTDLSVFANQAGSQATLYLAEVGTNFAGKSMEVSLFDAGEGASTIEILDPAGSPVSFTWSTNCNPPTAPSGGCSGSGTSLNVSGTGTQPYSNLSSTSRYNDRTMKLRVQLPADYATVFGGKVWWSIRLTTGASSVNDRSTWSVDIVGEPVHLVD